MLAFYAVSFATAFCDPLPSWNDAGFKGGIIDFVERTTTTGSPDFFSNEDRIAVFDNDGTLICEKPIYIQFAYALDRVKELAPLKPEWKHMEPFSAALDGRLGSKGLADEDEHKDFAKLVWGFSFTTMMRSGNSPMIGIPLSVDSIKRWMRQRKETGASSA